MFREGFQIIYPHSLDKLRNPTTSIPKPHLNPHFLECLHLFFVYLTPKFGAIFFNPQIADAESATVIEIIQKKYGVFGGNEKLFYFEGRRRLGTAFVEEYFRVALSKHTI